MNWAETRFGNATNRCDSLSLFTSIIDITFVRFRCAITESR